ncbi:hypothetical protein [Photobacterium sp. 1_MG-2023]|uniref:hypothetical protein n=1 Tax=Photobacterium sp. 1_MG-2023 TaxID=3062646 RepID=UPI0026E1B276|nr:hypothetical protein [Photobacterium sp. 1_MG-2023]MDO6705089.1 hypothetical protein [Photobacterium sp. 1_MG-2023]
MLVIWQSARVFAASDYEKIFRGGLRIDLSTLGYLFLPVLLLVCLTTLFSQQQRMRIPLKIYLISGSLLLLFFEGITPTFMLEYSLRPNLQLIDYLASPKEVFSVLMGSYWSAVTLTLMGLMIVGHGLGQVFQKIWYPVCTSFRWSQLFVQLMFLCILVLCARGTLAHKPVSPALVAFSSDHLLNDLSLNSAYAVGYAWGHLRNERGHADDNGGMAPDSVLRTMHHAKQRPGTSGPDPSL